MHRYYTFIPRTEPERSKWFDNYIQTLPEFGPLTGMSPEDITAKLDRVRKQQSLTADAKQKTIEKENATKLKNVNLETLLNEIKQDVDHMKTHPGWTPEMSARMQTDSIRVRKDLNGYQPEVTLSQNGNLVQIDYTKYGASGAHIYRKLPGETVMTMIGRSTDSTFTDPLPLAVPGVPELRQYMVILLIKDEETGLPSKTMTIVLGA
jgi:hypothetical protein